MKAHIYRSPDNIPAWMREVAIAEGRRQANLQAEDVTKRTLNEVWMAMAEAGLAPRTIERVRDTYIHKVQPYIARFEATPGHPEWHDASCDDVRRSYLERRGLPYEEPSTDGKV